MDAHPIKKSTSFHWNSYGMMEYMLVLSPGEQVIEKVLHEMQDFYQQFGDKPDKRPDLFISVANFLAKEGMEETLNRWIRNICNRNHSFELALNNYSGFPPDTIYARIQDPTPIFNLFQQLKILDDFILTSDCPPIKKPTRPHLTIARKLSLDVFNKALKEYSQKDFHESFVVEELILLKRSHQFDACTTVNKFHFLPGTENCYRTM